MDRRTAALLASIIAIGAALRYAAIPAVGVWVDAGFYAYDTRLILEGKRPFIDFLGRSPLFLYFLAGVRSVIGYEPEVFRGAISALWLATTLPVYGLAAETKDRTAGLVAAALYCWLPFGIVYGSWLNTMSGMALLATAGLYLVVRDNRPRWWAAAGVLLSGAFLARRSAFVVAGAIGLLALADRYHDRLDWRGVATRWTAFTAAWVGTLLVAYALLAPGHVLELAETHAVNLVLTTGRGGWPMIDATVSAPSGGNTTWGRWTARTLAKTSLALGPALGLAIAPGASHVARRWLDDRAMPYFVAILAAAGLYAVYAAVSAGHWTRLGAFLGFAAVGVVVYRTDLPTDGLLRRRAWLAVVLPLLAIFLAYFARDRVLHTYYAMDLWPLLSVVAAVCGVVLWRRGDRPGRALLAVLLVSATVTSGAAAHPLTNIVLHDNEAEWFTTGNMQAIEADMDQRTDAGDVVITNTASYIAGTDARMVRDDSRATAHVFSTFHYGNREAAPYRWLYDNLTRLMRTGDATHVVLNHPTAKMLAANATTEQLFETRYCEVDAGGIYAETNATLYRHAPASCPTARPAL